MASSTTRSSKRPEAHTTRSRSLHHGRNIQHQISAYEVPNTRKKRLRDSLELEQDTVSSRKVRRVSVLGGDLRSNQLRKGSDLVLVDHRDLIEEQGQQVSVNRATVAIANGLISTQYQTLNAAAVNGNLTIPPRFNTVHHEKVVAGLRHELDRLQPAEADRNSKDEKRKLRSQESSRFKSELSLYFQDYDVVIGNDVEERHALNVDTPIIVVDSQPQPSRSASPGKIRIPKTPSRLPPKSYPSSLYDDICDAKHIDFSALEAELVLATTNKDPFLAPCYELAHKRQERLERNIRNNERGKAQHERDQIVRLLEGLQGHDWLRIMGVTAIIESRRKDFIPARDHFIRGCETIIDKFRAWRDEEKRRKAEKDRLLAEVEEEDSDIDSKSDGDPPDYSDVDHAAARQLHEEAISRLESPASSRAASLLPPPIVKEFRSFYKKPHLRQAALSSNRRSARGASAFGVPLPDPPEHPFELPPGFINVGSPKPDARSRRREKRLSR